jgi:hypothetical protein
VPDTPFFAQRGTSTGNSSMSKARDGGAQPLGEVPLSIAGQRAVMSGTQRTRPSSSLDESAKLIAEEPVEIEAEVPAEENQSVERIDEGDRFGPPMFDE